MAESLHGEKYEIQFAAPEESQDSGYLDENEIGFINVLYGRY